MYFSRLLPSRISFFTCIIVPGAESRRLSREFSISSKTVSKSSASSGIEKWLIRTDIDITISLILKVSSKMHLIFSTVFSKRF